MGAEEAAMLEQLMRHGRVVTVAYSSNTAGLFDLGWGDCELVGDVGEVVWSHWERLPMAGPDAGYGGLRIPIVPTSGPAPVRFDAGAPDDDDFGLTPRSPLAGEPTSEPDVPQLETGSDPEQQ